MNFLKRGQWVRISVKDADDYAFGSNSSMMLWLRQVRHWGMIQGIHNDCYKNFPKNGEWGYSVWLLNPASKRKRCATYLFAPEELRPIH